MDDEELEILEEFDESQLDIEDYSLSQQDENIDDILDHDDVDLINITEGEDTGNVIAIEEPRKRRRMKVIPENAHPIIKFCIEKGFELGEIMALTKLSRLILQSIIEGRIPPDDYEKHRIYLTLGIKL